MTVTNSPRFPGQYYDQETGLHYNYFRDYHPGIGRYIESDPMGGLPCGLDIDMPNHLYSYTVSNPVNYYDSVGLIRNPKKCAKAMAKAMEKCGDDFDKFRDSIMSQLEGCEDRWLDCWEQGKVDKCPGVNDPCKMFEGVNGPAQARIRCAKEAERWLQSVKENITRKCYLALGKMIWGCL